MRKISILLALVAGLFATQANADWTGKDAAGATTTFKNPGACTSVVCVPVFQLYDGTNVVTLTTAGADAVSNTLTGLPAYSRMLIFNGTTWDRWQGAVTVTGGATSALQSSAAAAKGEGATGAAVPSGAQYGGMNVGGNLTGLAGISAGADAISNTNNQLLQGAFNYFYNGTTWDRIRGTVAGGMLVNVSNTNANGQATMANSSPVTIASNQTANALWGHGATGAGVPANATYFGYNVGGNLTGASAAAPLPVRPGDGTRNAIIDPCEANAQTFAPILMTTATTLRIIAPSASNKNYICSLFLKASAADNVALVEGTGGSCVTGIAGIIGGTTTANGFVFGTAGDGVLLQSGGKVAIAQTAGTNVDTCLITSTTGPLIGGVRYVQAP